MPYDEDMLEALEDLESTAETWVQQDAGYRKAVEVIQDAIDETEEASEEQQRRLRWLENAIAEQKEDEQQKKKRQKTS